MENLVFSCEQNLWSSVENESLQMRTTQGDDACQVSSDHLVACTRYSERFPFLQDRLNILLVLDEHILCPVDMCVS